MNTGPGKLSTDSVIVSSNKPSKRSKKFRPPIIPSSSSSDDSGSDTPSLERLRSHSIKKVDQRIRELDHSSHLSGNDQRLKHKSKRGGNVEVSVKRKVPWPHEPILGGVSRQRVIYDQLFLTQWVQGFCQNIPEQKSSERKHRVHAQKRISNKSGWVKPSDHSGRKPWYCTNYLIGVCSYSRDHELNGRIHKHICSFCLAGGGK